MANDTDQVNEGEGNGTAARTFNGAQRRFVVSQPVKEKAREAERALDGPEAEKLTEAEAIGRGHIAGEDPAVHRDDHEKVKARAYEIYES